MRNKKYHKKSQNKLNLFWILVLILFIILIIIGRLQEKKEGNRDYGFKNKSAVHLVLKSTFYFLFIFPRTMA